MGNSKQSSQRGITPDVKVYSETHRLSMYASSLEFRKDLLSPSAMGEMGLEHFLGDFCSKIVENQGKLMQKRHFLRISARNGAFLVIVLSCRAGGTRTHTLLRAADFKSAASANSATAPTRNESVAPAPSRRNKQSQRSDASCSEDNPKLSVIKMCCESITGSSGPGWRRI
jgi:hypothetical protein